MTVRQLLENTSSKELTEWRAYFLVRSEEEKKAELERQARAKLGRRKGG